MADLAMLDRAFYTIMQSLIETGRSPHYSQVAASLGISLQAAQQLYHDLEDVETGYSFFLHPETEQIVSVAPFNDLPTPYRISVDGEQKWYAQ